MSFQRGKARVVTVRPFPLCHRTAKRDEPCADFANGAAAVLPKIGDRLVVGNRTPRQPHHLDVATGFPFEPTARLHPVQIAINVELEQDRGMIARPTRRFGSYTAETIYESNAHRRRDGRRSELVQNVDQLSVRWGGPFAEGLNRGCLGESVEPDEQANALTAGKLGLGRAPAEE